VCSGSVAPGGHVTDDGEWTPSAIALVRFGADGDTSLETFKAAYRTTVAQPLNIPDDVLDDVYERFMATRLDQDIPRVAESDPLAFYHQEDAAVFQSNLRTLTMPVSVIWGGAKTRRPRTGARWSSSTSFPTSSCTSCRAAVTSRSTTGRPRSPPS